MEQHGAGEAYLPVLEALGRIGRSPGGEQLVTILRQYAPTWLVQMPALLVAEEMETLQRRVVGATRERMLREMVEAIEVLTAHHPLVLWFEDLHWADASTVDWLAAIAQRGAPVRLLVIGTYRPSDLSLSGHPLRAVKQELVAKGQSEELLLPFLSADDVTPCDIEGRSCALPQRVNAGRIAIVIAQPRKHRFKNLRIHLRGRVIVEINDGLVIGAHSDN